MELKELIKNVGRELEKRGIDYMIIGGQAVLLYGEPRLTRDIDITLGINIDRYQEIKEIIEKLNLKILPDNPLDFLKKTMVLPVIDEETGIRLDFIFSFSEYERQALKRVKKIKIDDTEICYPLVKNLIIHKIISERERDWEDEKILNEKLVERFQKIKGS
ncbi:MAG: nucleotidyl transferase AbiEii/AbiGii toxin family protein [candidate division WOR-3 bacterium]